MRAACLLALCAGFLLAGPPEPQSACMRAKGPAPDDIYPITGHTDLDAFIRSERIVLQRTFGVKPHLRLVKSWGGPDVYAARSRNRTGEPGYVVFGLDLMREQLWKHDRNKAAVAAMMAHAHAHILQFKTGCALTGRTRELHADFMAGYYVGRRKHVVGADQARAFAGEFFRFGHAEFRNPATHGAPAARVDAFVAGFQARRLSAEAAALDAEGRHRPPPSAEPAAKPATEPESKPAPEPRPEPVTDVGIGTGIGAPGPRPGGIWERVRIRCVHTRLCVHRAPCEHRIECEHVVPCVHRTECGHFVACEHQVPCRHRVKCTHKTGCEHKVRCTHRKHEYDFVHEFDVIAGVKMPCTHTRPCVHRAHDFDYAHPYDLEHRFHYEHEFDLLHPYDREHEFDYEHELDQLHEFDHEHQFDFAHAYDLEHEADETWVAKDD